MTTWGFPRLGALEIQILDNSHKIEKSMHASKTIWSTKWVPRWRCDKGSALLPLGKVSFWFSTVAIPIIIFFPQLVVRMYKRLQKYYRVGRSERGILDHVHPICLLHGRNVLVLYSTIEKTMVYDDLVCILWMAGKKELQCPQACDSDGKMDTVSLIWVSWSVTLYPRGMCQYWMLIKMYKNKIT